MSGGTVFCMRRKIPMATKREVAAREGYAPGDEQCHCAYCLEEGDLCWDDHGVDLLGFHWDHKIPVAAGGGNEPDNIRIACPSCNYTKAAKVNWISDIARYYLDTYPGEYDYMLEGGVW